MTLLNVVNKTDTQIIVDIEKWLLANPFQTDPWGNVVRIANPERGSITNRAEHLSGRRNRQIATTHQRQVADDKAITVPTILDTIKAPHAVVHQYHDFIYLRKYADGRWHAVFTDGNGGLLRTQTYNTALISQRALDASDELKTGEIVALRGQPSAFRFKK